MSPFFCDTQFRIFFLIFHVVKYESEFESNISLYYREIHEIITLANDTRFKLRENIRGEIAKFRIKSIYINYFKGVVFYVNTRRDSRRAPLILLYLAKIALHRHQG